MLYRIKSQTDGLKSLISYRIAYDICDLAMFLNRITSQSRHLRVVRVTVIDEYDIHDDDDSGREVAFLPLEYNNQRFIETYEERLISSYEFSKRLELLV